MLGAARRLCDNYVMPNLPFLVPQNMLEIIQFRPVILEVLIAFLKAFSPVGDVTYHTFMNDENIDIEQIYNIGITSPFVNDFHDMMYKI